MGIILRETSTGRGLFFVKGADFIMKDLVQQFKRGFVIDECDNLAMDGLRTLVFAMKTLTQESLAKFQREFEEAGIDLSKRDRLQFEAVDRLEAGL